MDPQIEHLLSQVARRFRSYRLAWLLTLLWCGLWLALALGILPFPSGGFGDLSRNILPMVWIGGALLVLWIVSRFWFRDLVPIAKRVEEKFPSLEQRLLTATSASNTQSSAFLRRRLVQETIRHARAYDWTNTLASYRYWTAWSVQWLAFAALVAWIAIGFTGDYAANSVILQGLNAFSTNVGMTVEPGDVELEKGSDLLVTARFTGPVPAAARLLLTPDEGSGSSLAMTQALKDPVFGISVRNLERSIRYQVVSGSFESPIYRVEIFEYPALIRSDATLKPPTFTGQSVKTIEDTRRVTVVEGTELTWTCSLNKPVRVAELVNEQGLITPLIQDASNPTQYTATFVMEESQRWQLRLVDSDSRSAKFDEELVGRVLPNQMAAIKVESPADQRVSALQEINIAATVTDDYGILRAGVTYSLSGADPTEIVLLDAATQPSRKEIVSYDIELEKLQAQPDQVLSYYFWIEDLDRDGNTRHVVGDMFFAEIRPFEELFREGDSPAGGNSQQAQQQSSQAAGMAEELAETQKKIITATWNSIRNASGQSVEKRREAAEIILDSQQQARAQTSDLSEKIKDERSAAILESLEQSMDRAIEKLETSVLDPESGELRDALPDERAAYEGLLRLRAREHSIVQSQQSQSQSQSQSASQRNRQQQIEQLQLEDDQNRYESESRPDTLQEAAEREMRQIMNRLDELARRQQDLNEQLRELDLALREAKDEEERKKLEEELRRLRDNQQELLRDTDEMLERMNKEENQQPMQESRQQMEEAREQMQQSTQAMSEQKTSSALTSGSRAEQTMEETRDTLRQQSSQGLQQSMRDLVQQASELERQQQALEQRMPGKPTDQQSATPNSDKENATRPSNETPPETSSGSILRPDSDESGQGGLEEAWKDQKEKLETLLNRLRETVTESETSEPLLADELYDSYRKAKTDGIEQQLDLIPQYLQRGLDEPARQAAEESTEKIQSLREQIEKSSESILGSESESLRRALKELDRARDQLQQEIDANADELNEDQANDRGQGRSQPGTEALGSQQPGSEQPGSQQPGSEQPGNEQPGNEQPGSQQPGSEQPGSQQPGSEQPGSEQPGTEQQSQGQQSQGQPGSARGGGTSREAGNAERGGSGLDRMAAEAAAEAPLTGGEFNEWTDAIRDVEELVRDPDLKAEAGRIREAAREMRIEFKRHAKEPEWPLVRRLIAEPMDQLRARIAQDLLRKSAEKNQIVPIDRDPVPNQFQRQLNRYYENLGTSSGL